MFYCSSVDLVQLELYLFIVIIYLLFSIFFNYTIAIATPQNPILSVTFGGGTKFILISRNIDCSPSILLHLNICETYFSLFLIAHYLNIATFQHSI